MSSLPRLPGYVPGASVQGGSGRISARAANDLERTPRERTLTIGAAGKLLPIAFGRRDIPGRIFAWAVHNSDLYIGVLWCVGECQEIEAVYINDEALPGSGVTVTHYLGTDSQGVDPSLDTAIAAYADTMRVDVGGTWVGICYSVFVIEPAALDGFPRSFRAVGKWRKVWDPRTSTRVYSDNSALIGRELITDPIIGLGLPVTGDIACANWADELLGGTIPRGRVSFVMDSARDIYRSWLPLIAEYGEFFYDLSGEGINMTPDAPSWFVPEREPEQVQELVAGNHGTNEGGVFRGSAGRHGLAFGTADYADFGFTVSATSWLVEVTLLWQSPFTSARYLIDQTDRYIIELSGASGPASGNIQFFDGAWSASTVAAKQNEWCRYSFHFRADNVVNVYLDGVHVGSATGVDIKDWSSPKLMINRDGLNNGSAGIASEFRIWDVGGKTTGQVAAQIEQYAGARLNGDEPGLRIYCPMNDIAKITARDVVSQPDGRSGMTMVAEPGSDTPTVVEVRYTEPSADGKPWSTGTASRQLPGVDSGEVARIPTSVGLEGVYRAEDASNRALARLNRLRNRITVTWQTRDYGIEHHRGRVVEIDRADIGIETYARVMQVDYAGPGRYQVIAQRYSDDQHPSELELPADTTTVPVGLIIPLAGSEVPSGYEAWTAANGRYLMGTNVTAEVGDTGGNAEFAGFSITSSTDPMHSGTLTKFLGNLALTGGGSVGRLADNPGVLNHSHSLTTGAFDPDLPRRNTRWVKKTGTPGISVPSTCRVMGIDGITTVSRITSHAGRFAVASTENANAGVFTRSVTLTTATSNQSHRHTDSFSGLDVTIGTNPVNRYADVSSGNHDHGTPSITVTRAIAAYNVGLYGSDTDFEVVPGMMGLWEDPESLPTDWVVVTDALERLLKFAGEATSVEDLANELSISGVLPNHSHTHQGSLQSNTNRRGDLDHTNHTHTHTYSASGAWLPPWYKIALIMYQPGQ